MTDKNRDHGSGSAKLPFQSECPFHETVWQLFFKAWKPEEAYANQAYGLSTEGQCTCSRKATRPEKD